MPPGLQNVETQNQRLRWVFFPTSTRVSLSYARIQSYPPHHRITKKNQINWRLVLRRKFYMLNKVDS